MRILSRRIAAALAVAFLIVSVAPAPAPAGGGPPRTPVVVVLFDELPITSLLAGDGRIDRSRYPNFARLAGNSTWYVNATTASDSTERAIPSVLDGRAPRRGVPPTAQAHRVNLFTLLKPRGYRLRVGEEATSLCPYPECRRRFGRRYFLAHDRLIRFRRWIASIGPSEQPTLYYKHILLPHIPWIFLPTGQRYTHTVRGPIPGLSSSEISVFDPTLVRQAWQRHLLQAGAADHLVGAVLDRLKETGVYSRAMVVVMADHGVSFRLGKTDRRTIVPDNARDIAPIPLFVKDPGQTQGRRSQGLVRPYDVLPTIAARIGLPLPRGLNGRVASSPAVLDRGRVTVLSRSGIRQVTMSRGRLLGLKQEALRRQIALFGSGSRSLYDFGPNRSLRGKPVRRLRVAAGGPLRARLSDPRDYLDVQPEASFLPVFPTGRITGGRAGSRRDIAVAINGVVRGVTRSVRLRGKPAEYFSVLVDPHSLEAGRNEVQVLSVDRVGGRYTLRRIYGRPYSGPPAGKPAEQAAALRYPRPSDG